LTTFFHQAQQGGMVTWLRIAKNQIPNDIPSVNHKLAGVLVETQGFLKKKSCDYRNTFNVNQTDFIHAA
jgi:hypothetical protein